MKVLCQLGPEPNASRPNRTDLLDTLLLYLLPELIQLALKLVHLGHCSSYDLIEERMVRGDVSVEGVVQWLELLGLLEEMERKGGREEGVRSMNGCSGGWCSVWLGNWRTVNETGTYRVICSEFQEVRFLLCSQRWWPSGSSHRSCSCSRVESR